MSPTQFHAKREIINNENIGIGPSPLKINKDSHFIKKSPSRQPTSAFSTSAIATITKPQQRHQPVIIYTHSPKIIHTTPCDFMALVQKLTGISRSDLDFDHRRHPPRPPKQEPDQVAEGKNLCRAATDDNDSSSVITEENCSASVVGDVQINSCFGNNPPPTIFDPPNPCFNNLPFFTHTSSDFLSSAPQPFFPNYMESLLLMPNMRSSSFSSSSSNLESTNEFHEF